MFRLGGQACCQVASSPYVCASCLTKISRPPQLCAPTLGVLGVSPSHYACFATTQHAPATRKRSGKPSTRKSKSAKTTAPKPSNSEEVKLLKETLNLLRSLQISQRPLPPDAGLDADQQGDEPVRTKRLRGAPANPSPGTQGPDGVAPTPSHPQSHALGGGARAIEPGLSEPPKQKMSDKTLKLLKNALTSLVTSFPAGQSKKGGGNSKAKHAKKSGHESAQHTGSSAVEAAGEQGKVQAVSTDSAIKASDRGDVSADANSTSESTKRSKSKVNQSLPRKRGNTNKSIVRRVASRSLSHDDPKDKKPSEKSMTGSRAVPRGDSKSSKSAKACKSGLGFRIQSINSSDLHLIPVKQPLPAVPPLSYGLDRVLFNPGVYHLQDPRSKVFNFDPYLSTIMPVQEFDFDALKEYVTSSKDTKLISIAAELERKYTGSTSSMTSMLAHFHFLLSSWRPINPVHTSRSFAPDSARFTEITRAPAAIFLQWKNGTYAIDADKGFDTANVLSMLGKSMEKLLTLPKDEYEKYRRTNSDQISEEERNAEEGFHYTTMGDFLMRSQLDAHDRRLPGTGMFDLKTRAVVTIRMDAKDFHKGVGYEIRSRVGQWESFEREYYDMIRAAFLKYSLQVRMGRMDGIFVAFHNTRRIFGFQYISISEMDLAIHGTEDTSTGDSEFKLSIHLLNKVLDRATARFPGRSIQLHFETRPTEQPLMYIFARPVDQQEIDRIQNANRASVEEFERRILGMAAKEPENEAEEVDEEPATEGEDPEDSGIAEDDYRTQDLQRWQVWDGIRQRVEETMENDALGTNVIREAIEDALEQSGLLTVRSPKESHNYVDTLLEAITSAEITDGSADGESDSFPETGDYVDNNGDEDVDMTIGSEGNELQGQSDVEMSGLALGEDPAATSAGLSEGMAEAGLSEGEKTSDVGGEALLSEEDAPAVSSIAAAAEGEHETTDDSVGVEEAAAADTEAADTEAADTEAVDTEAADTEAADTEAVDTEAADTEAASDATLKDLIVKLAEHLEANPVTQRSQIEDPSMSPEQAAAVKSSRLQKFAGLLSELVERSKAATEDEEPEEEQSSATNGEHAAQSRVGAGNSETDQQAAGAPSVAEEEIMGMILTVRNRVDEKYVERPENLKPGDNWTVEYAIEDIESKRAQRLYAQVKTRREKALGPRDMTEEWYKIFSGKLAQFSKQGQAFRKKETEVGKKSPVNIYGVDTPLKWHDVFEAEDADPGPATESLQED